jgi:D-xylose transport system ATP-binding protein
LSAEPVLRVAGVSKRFGALQALDGVSFEVHAGEVVALLGDNGAGKSTLVNILSGGIQADDGDIFFDGEPADMRHPGAAKALGIETVYQDLSLCPNVDVVANFFMGRELVKRVLGLPLLDEGRMERETAVALSDLGVELPSMRVHVEHLSGGQRQAIELSRFIHWGGRLVLLDEPFAALGVEQTRLGLELIARAQREGVAVIVITHNLIHAFQVADRAVVLRLGRVAGTRTMAATDTAELVGMITGVTS